MKICIDDSIIAKSIKAYGKETQSIVCMEECSELIQCISKELRGKSDINHLAEEIADVLISIEALRQMYDIHPSKIQTWIAVKHDREQKRLKEINKSVCNCEINCSMCPYYTNEGCMIP